MACDYFSRLNYLISRQGVVFAQDVQLQFTGGTLIANSYVRHPWEPLSSLPMICIVIYGEGFSRAYMYVHTQLITPLHFRKKFSLSMQGVQASGLFPCGIYDITIARMVSSSSPHRGYVLYVCTCTYMINGNRAARHAYRRSHWL